MNQRGTLSCAQRTCELLCFIATYQAKGTHQIQRHVFLVHMSAHRQVKAEVHESVSSYY
jgi:hypothetical protein